ncbi:MAG: DUF4251 domain-containing protein [Bacteroidetes bacterium]|nr:DUF4251 domain-containing protein [Bacteroidota bacterium]
MKTINLILLFTFLMGGMFAQSVKTEKELRKEAAEKKKEARKAKLEKEFEATAALLISQRFVLEAQTTGNRFGDRRPSPSNLNFIMVDSVHAVLQVGSSGRVGLNDVGGITLDGTITSWKLEKNDKGKTFDLYMTIITKIRTYDVIMSVSASGYASASINGNTASTLIFDGNLVSLEESGVYKGRSY